MPLSVRLIPTAICIGLLACSTERHPSYEWIGNIDSLGDTTRTTTVSGYTDSGNRLIVRDSLEILWSSDQLSTPRAMTMLGDSMLAVLDQDRVFVVSVRGQLLRTIGRAGQGPGEFQDPRAVASRGDTLFVYDAASRRLTGFLADGQFINSWLLTPHPDFINYQAPALLIRDGVMTSVWASVVQIASPGPTSVAAIALPLSGDSARVIAKVGGPTYKMLPNGSITPVQVFGPRPLFALSPEGTIAWSDGQEFCVTVRPASKALQRICRAWQRVPLAETARHPDLTSIAGVAGWSKAQTEGLQLMFDNQESGPLRNSIDRLLWDSSGDLWVRIIDSTQGAIHPWLLDRVPALRPPHFEWSVFQPDGRLSHEVVLPSGFDLRLVVDGWAYGLVSTQDGVPFVARIRLDS